MADNNDDLNSEEGMIAEWAEGGEGEEAPAEDGGEPPAETGEPPAETGEAPAEGDEEKKDDGPSEIAKRIEADPFELWFLEKYKFPEEVKFDHIPRISDSRSVWRLGMRKLEETFAEHIANMHLDFERKADKF
jgi:hypothetical protein